MRRRTISILALAALAACGRKGARSSDFDSATAAALATGAGATAADYPKVPRIYSMTTGHALDRHDMIFGGGAQAFALGDSILVSVKGQFLPSGTDVGARIRLKNTVIDSTAAKAGAADTAGFSYVGLRFASGKKWAKGTYTVEIFINGKFQVSQDVTLNTQ